MSTCEQCREQLLPYLYDLLEAHEKHDVAGHIDGCALCQESLKLARAQAGLLAEAVKPEAAAIVFKAPATATPVSSAPTVVMPRPRRRLFLLNRWSVAASILILLFSVAGVIGATVWKEQRDALAGANERLARAREDLSKSQVDLNKHKDQTQQEIRAIQNQIDEVLRHWKKDEAAAQKAQEKDAGAPIKAIRGPKNLQAGAPNRYDIEMNQNYIENFQQNQIGRNQKELPGMPQMNARLIEQKSQKVVFQQQLMLQQNNKANFDVPTDVPIKPNELYAIEFQMLDAEGKTINVRDYLNLAAPEYITHLATDRPMYRPGQTMRFRSLTLERFSLKPAQEEFHLRFRITGPPHNTEYFSSHVANQVVNANKEPLRGPGGQPLRGLGVGEFVLPATLPEGHFTLTVSEVNERFNEEKRTFVVRHWQTPRFNKEITFNRSGYRPGDPVKITVKATPIAMQPPGGRSGLSILANVKVNGQLQQVQNRNADAEGRAEFEFTLPANFVKGVAQAIIDVDDGSGRPESTVRTLPIVVRDLRVEFFPEGGDLIAGVPNRVYFQARTSAGSAAEFAGVIRDDLRQTIARVQSHTNATEPALNQGLGSFTFTPEAKKHYRLHIESPIGIDQQYQLPGAKDNGVVLHVPQGVVTNEFNVVLHSAGMPRDLLVGAYCRGRMLDHKFVRASANMATPVVLRPQADVGGVYRITVFEKKRAGSDLYYQPVAERLVYRKNQARVDVRIEPDRAWYPTGAPVELRLKALDEKKVPAPSIALIGVMDTSVNKLASEKSSRAMPTHFLLTTEIRNPEDLENADALLSDHPHATTALDLLLGSQGWRRFAEQDPKTFVARQQQGQAPNFLSNAEPVSQLLESEQKQLQKVDQAHVGKAIELNKKLASVESAEAGPLELQHEVDQMQREVDASQNAISNIELRLREVRGFLWQFLLGGALLVLLFIGFLLVSVGLRRLAEGGRAWPWVFIGLALLTTLFIVSVIGTFTMMGQPWLDHWRVDQRDKVKIWAPAPGLALPAPQAWPDPAPALTGEDDRKVVEEAAGRGNPLQRAPAAPVFGQAQDQGLPQDANVKLWGNEARQAPPRAPAQVLDDKALRQQGNYALLMERQLGRRVQLPPARNPCVVREYAHRRTDGKDETQRDLTETVFWHPAVILQDGKAAVQFDLSDAVTRYEVIVLSNTLDGRLGANRVEIDARLPFEVEPRTPVEITENDQLSIPVAVTNSTAMNVSASVNARARGLQIDGATQLDLKLAAKESRLSHFQVKPTITEGNAVFRVSAKTANSFDAVERKLKVVPDGIPITRSVGGFIDNGAAEHRIDLPEESIKGSFQVMATLFPSPVAELQACLDKLQRDPAGCMEHTAAISYMNVLLLQYFKQPNRTSEADFVLEKRTRQLLTVALDKLADFECVDPKDRSRTGGFDVFASSTTPDLASSALGLLLLGDAASVHRIDPQMLERTKRFLLNQRDGNGRFQRNLHPAAPAVRASDSVLDAFAVWALTQNNADELESELDNLRDACKQQKDPSLLALAALSHAHARKPDTALPMLRELRNLQRPDGGIGGGSPGITGATGRDVDVQATSLAILAWLKAEQVAEFSANLENAHRWLARERRADASFGCAFTSVLALQARVAHAKNQARNFPAGEATLSTRSPFGRQDRPDMIGKGLPIESFHPRAAFPARAHDPIVVALSEADVPGPNGQIVQLNLNNGVSIPYTLTWSHRALKPANVAGAPPLRLSAILSAEQAKEGDLVKLNALVENVSDQNQGMTVAVIGLPAGLSLREHSPPRSANKIASWELRGRELILCWRAMAPKAKLEVELDLRCTVPGTYRGPASHVHVYHNSERKFWIDPLNIRITQVD